MTAVTSEPKICSTLPVRSHLDKLQAGNAHAIASRMDVEAFQTGLVGHSVSSHEHLLIPP